MNLRTSPRSEVAGIGDATPVGVTASSLPSDVALFLEFKPASGVHLITEIEISSATNSDFPTTESNVVPEEASRSLFRPLYLSPAYVGCSSNKNEAVMELAGIGKD